MPVNEHDLDGVTELYPVKVNEYCARLAENSPAVRKMYYPDIRELESSPLPADGLGENPQSPLPKLIRRYPDRAVVLTTGNCFSRCRFCFRKRLWRTGACTENITPAELEDICRFFDGHPEIHDVLLSGGDVLTLPDRFVLDMVKNIRASGGIMTVRVCSRAPAVQPDRITDTLARSLGEIDGVWFMTHFDHPDELTPEAVAACRRLVSSGVPVLDQTVLLAGVNDDAETLMKLFRGLVSARVKPHYLFHVDPVEGVRHFATGADKGLDIMKVFRSSLSSIATPSFSLDLPGGEGKVVLSPDCKMENGCYISPLSGRAVKHPLA